MLGELEDEHTRLVQRHAEVLREADEIATEIERVEGVRAAITGRPVRRKAGRRGASAPGEATTTQTVRERDQAAAAERIRKITEYARERGGEFTGRQAAEAIGMPFQGVGPVLAGMVRRGEATVDEVDGTRVYTLVGV